MGEWLKYQDRIIENGERLYAMDNNDVKVYLQSSTLAAITIQENFYISPLLSSSIKGWAVVIGFHKPYAQ